MGLDEKLKEPTKLPTVVCEKILKTISHEKLKSLKTSKDAYENEKYILQSRLRENSAKYFSEIQDILEINRKGFEDDFKNIFDEKLGKYLTFESNRLIYSDQKKSKSLTSLSDLIPMYEKYLNSLKTSLDLKKVELEKKFESVSLNLEALFVKK
jgi:hypothetical protein